MVTIVEVHKLILDVCVSLIATIDENFFVDKLFGKSFILTVSQNHWLLESLSL